MRVALAANVALAAFAAHGLCEAVFELCLASQALLISNALLQEDYRGPREKIRLPESIAGRIVGLLRDSGENIVPLSVPRESAATPAICMSSAWFGREGPTV